jgi:hypothetical protein
MIWLRSTVACVASIFVAGISGSAAAARESSKAISRSFDGEFGSRSLQLLLHHLSASKAAGVSGSVGVGNRARRSGMAGALGCAAACADPHTTSASAACYLSPLLRCLPSVANSPPPLLSAAYQFSDIFFGHIVTSHHHHDDWLTEKIVQ